MTGDHRGAGGPDHLGGARVGHRRSRQARPMRIPVAGTAVTVLAVLAVFAFHHDKANPPHRLTHHRALALTLPHTPQTYMGVYATRGKVSYTGVRAFSRTTGVTPNLVVYYSAWFEPFQTGFAVTAAEHGAVPLVQINPAHVSLTAIASGKYDAYLSDYAAAVSSYRPPGHPELWPRDERAVVFLGLPARIPGGVRSGLAAHCDPVPRVEGPERDLAVDDQRHPQAEPPDC